jgi:fructose 1,6-bisphosphatase
MLQQRLVDFWSVRGWMRAKHRGTILGRRITEISQTYEQFPGPGRLHKVALDGDEQITVGFVFRP